MPAEARAPRTRPRTRTRAHPRAGARRPLARPPGRLLAGACAAALCATALSACASTLQDKPIPHNELEYMVVSPFPVYWLGDHFAGIQVSAVVHDPSDAWDVQYGNCVEGGEEGCVPTLQIVTSPDNSFVPGAATSSATRRIRGVRAWLSNGGRTIVLPTGGVVLDIYATSARAAAQAARTAVPINAVGAPEAPLPAALPNTGFGEAPLPSQMPSPLHPL